MRRKSKPYNRSTQPHYWRNHSIRARTMRVIDEQGEVVGVLSKEEALKKAHETGLDLVEVAPKAKPPVAKIIDYNKFLYEQNKKRREKKPVKSGEVKEIWLKPFMADHDLNSRIAKGKDLLDESGKLKVVVKFKRRQLSQKQFGFEVINKFVEGIENAQFDKKPKMHGSQLVAIVSKK